MKKATSIAKGGVSAYENKKKKNVFSYRSRKIGSFGRNLATILGRLYDILLNTLPLYQADFCCKLLKRLHEIVKSVCYKQRDINMNYGFKHPSGTTKIPSGLK